MTVVYADLTSLAITPFIVSSANSVKHWSRLFGLIWFFATNLHGSEKYKQKSQRTVTRKTGYELHISPCASSQECTISDLCAHDFEQTFAVHWAFSECFLSFWEIRV